MTTKLYKNTLSKLTLGLAAFTLLFGASSCKKDEIKGSAYIQVTNAAQAASPIDFYVNSEKKNTTALAYTQSAGYFQVVSQNAAQPAIIKSSASGTNLASFNISPQIGAYYSIYYFDGLTVAYQDDQTAPQPGKARVRFININLSLTNNLDVGLTGGAKIVNGLINKLNSDYVEVSPGASFSFYTAGTTTELIKLPTAIEAGHIYTVYLSGTLTADLKATLLLQK